MIDKIMAAENIRPQRREVAVSGDRNCFYRAVAPRRDETADEKHEEINRSSSLTIFSTAKTVTVSPTLTFLTTYNGPKKIKIHHIQRDN